MTTIEIILLVVVSLYAVPFVAYMTWNVIIVEIIDWINDRKLDKQLKKDWENKTGVYAYMKK